MSNEQVTNVEATAKATDEHAADAAVSSGNTVAAAEAKAAPEPKEVKINPIVMTIPKANDGKTYHVYVDDLDPTVFKNTRKEFDLISLNEMRKSFKTAGGQLQEIVGSVQPNGKIAVIAGYTRTEAFSRNAHQPLIDRWNKEHNLESDSPNFLRVDEPTHREMVRNAYPNDWQFERNKTHNIPRVNLNAGVTDAVSARVQNLVENMERSDFTVQETIDGMKALIEGGMKQGEVATKLKKSPGVISQFLKVGRLADSLRTILVTPETGEQMSEADLTKLKENTTALVAELERRLNLKKNADDAISFSHLREFSGRVVRDSGEPLPLTRVQIMGLLADIVGADDKSFKINSKKTPMNYTVWMNKMKISEQETEAHRSGKKAAAETAAATADATSTAVATDSPAGTTEGTVAGLAAQQATAVSTGKTDEVKPAAAAAEANADFTDKTVDKSLADTAAAALGVDVDALDDDSEPEPAALKTEGRKSQMAPGSQYKFKSIDAILAALDTYAEIASQPETEDFVPNPFMICAAMGSVAFGYEVIGGQATSKEWKEKLEEHAQEMDEYLEQLEEYAEKAGKKAKLPFDLERPMLSLGALVTEEPAEGDESEVEPEDLVDGSENEDLEEVGDEDLAELGDIEGLEDEAAE